MATTERVVEGPKRTRTPAFALGGLLAVLAVVVIVSLRRPAQIGPDEEVFRTVDALYTAVCGRDEKRLADCEQRLHNYRASGKLPDDAAEFLDRVIANCRGGAWESAAERLYDFMLAQKREGAEAEHKEQPKAKPDPKGKAGRK